VSKSADSFKRNNNPFKPEPKILAICEDKKSSKSYLEDVAKHFRAHLKVKFDHCGKTDPLGIVKEAIDSLRKYDHVYCVIDRDDHLNFNQAISLAALHPEVTVITSYPCFEFWLIIHFGHCAKPFNKSGKKSAGDQVVEFLRKKPDMKDYAKGSFGLFEKLLGQRFDTARKLSPAILNQAASIGNLNPSTEMHLIIDKIEELSEPQH